MKHSIKISILMVIAIISTSNVFATIRTWSGASSTSWAASNNWSGGAVPGANDTVVIPASLTRYPLISSGTPSNVSIKRLVMNGGTFGISSKTLTVTGSAVFTSGTFTANSNFTTANLTINGATITSGNGATFTSSSTAVFSSGTFTCNSNFSSSNFTISGGTFTSGSTCTFTVSTYLLLNSGTLDLSSVNSYTVKDLDLNGGTMTVDGGNASSFGTGLVSLDGGTLVVASGTGTLQTSSTGKFDFISGTINMNNQTLDIRGKYTYSGGTYSNVALLSVSVYNFDYSGTLNIGYKMRIRDTLNFINGKIQLTNYSFIHFRSSAVAVNYNSNKYIDGPVKKSITTSTMTSFEFPIGNANAYAPLTISNMASRNSSDTFTAQYFTGAHANASGTKASGLSVVSNQEYWILNRTSGGTASTTATVSLSYDATRSGSITDAALLKVVRWDGSQWADHGRASGSSTSNTSGSLTSSANVTSFSPFTLGSSSNVNPLPVHLLDFSAKAIASNVNVKWSTTSEINNDFFSVEKSLDGKNWSAIGEVKGAGNTESLTNYNFVDANPVNGVQYYRLKQVDVNGQFTYSNIAPVNFSNNTVAQLNIFPMPATTNVNIELPGVTEMTVSIYNVNGQKVYENTSGAFLNIDIQNFDAGLYMVEVKADNQTINSKFLKN